MSERHAARAARRGATSPACWSIRCRRCIRTPTRRPIPRWSTAAAARSSTATAYADWLQQLRAVCTRARHRADLRRGVRRLPPRAAAARRNISACAPTWSPTARRSAAACRSACCAAASDLMKRFRDDRPADICFARGTFNSHPYVMGAMHEFLRALETPEIRALYDGLDELWNGARRAAQRAAARRRACRCGSPTCRRSGRSATRSRRATTGCCSTTCAPRAWR